MTTSVSNINTPTKVALASIGTLAGGGVLYANRDSSSTAGKAFGALISGGSIIAGILSIVYDKTPEENAGRTRIENSTSNSEETTDTQDSPKRGRISGSIPELITKLESDDDKVARQSMRELMLRFIHHGQKLDEKTASAILICLKLDKSINECPRLTGFLSALDKYKPGQSNVNQHARNRANLSKFKKCMNDEFPELSDETITEKSESFEILNIANQYLRTLERVTRNQTRSALSKHDGFIKIARATGKRAEIASDINSASPVVAMKAMHELVSRYLTDGQKLSDKYAFKIVEGLLLDADTVENENTSPTKPHLATPRLEGFLKATDKVEVNSSPGRNIQIRANLLSLKKATIAFLTGHESSTRSNENGDTNLSEKEAELLDTIRVVISKKRGQMKWQQQYNDIRSTVSSTPASELQVALTS